MGNAISGLIKTESGEPVAGAVVRLRRSDYLSSIHHLLPQKRGADGITEIDTVTDDDGMFRMDSIAPGEYFVEVTGTDSLTALFEIEINSSDTLVTLSEKYLDRPAIICGNVNLPPGISGAWIQVYGLERLMAADSATGAFCVSVPGGIFDLHIFSLAGRVSIVDIKEVAVKAGDTSNIGTVYPGYHTIPSIDTVVLGKIVKDNGEPAQGIVVQLFPGSFNSITGVLPDSLMAITNMQGGFLFKNIAAGNYRIEAKNLSDGSSSVSAGFTASEDTAFLPTDTLRQPGTLLVHVPDSLDVADGVVYLPNTGAFAILDSASSASGLVRINNIPAGNYPALRFSLKPDLQYSVVVAESLSVTPGQLTEIGPYYNWKHSYKITINTGIDGADISDDVVDFPLLLRLTHPLTPSLKKRGGTQGGEFNFKLALPDGADIRFSKSDGAPLPFETEYWDGENGTAAVWVKIDTVYGNNDSQYIYLYTGNSLAHAISSGPSVFGTEDGYTSVWHIPHDLSGGDSLIRDATVAANHGTARGKASPIAVSSAVANGLSLDGDEQFIFMKNKQMSPGVFTLSCWVNTTTDSGGRIIGFGDSYPFLEDALQSVDRWIWMDDTGRLHFSVYDENKPKDTHGMVSSAKVYNDNAWHLVSAVFSSQSQLLYVDGFMVSANYDLDSFNISMYEGYWSLGHFINAQEADTATASWPHVPSSRYFRGAIDEVRICGKPKSSDWIQLCYQTQKQEASVVRIE